MTCFSREVGEIGEMIRVAAIVATVRKEVAKAVKDGVVVTEGRYYGGRHDVVVHGGADDELARRIRGSIPNVEIERIAKGVLGINTSRRGRAS